jgi:hypothetical protein
MPIVAIKKNPMASKTDAPLYVNIIGAEGDGVGSIVTAVLNPREYPRDILVDSGRDIRLSRSGKLTYRGIDLSPVFEYLDTVHYVADGETGDETVTAYRVRIIPKPGLYSLTRKGLSRLPTP